MTPFKTVSEKLSAWRRYREVVRELAQLSDYELHDIGVLRTDIEFIARRPFADKATGAIFRPLTELSRRRHVKSHIPEARYPPRRW